jgi:segregation and condensation protein B
MQDLKNIIESLLFVADEPLSIDKIKEVLETIDAKEIRSVLQGLAEDYESRGGGFKLCEVAGGWQLRSRPEYHEWIKRMLQPSPQRLSRAALETLAIIAYKQPIIRADIEHIRGVDSGGVLRQLMERKLIRVLGRREIAGRPLIYATTRVFLELFDLKDLKDLPSPAEIEQLGQSAGGFSQLDTGLEKQSFADSDIAPQSPADIASDTPHDDPARNDFYETDESLSEQDRPTDDDPSPAGRHEQQSPNET